MFREYYFKIRDCYYRYITTNLTRIFLALLGIKVGKNFFSRAIPSIVIDKASAISIGDDVILKGKVEIRAIKGAVVTLESGVRLDVGVRIVATNSAKVQFSEGADIGCYSIFNCGDNFCYFQTSDHKINAGERIKYQGYNHGEISIGDDSWIAGGCFVLSGVTIDDGCVVGANSVVNKALSKDSIAVGSPAKIIQKRR